MKIKPFITYGIAILFLLVVVFLFVRVLQGLTLNKPEFVSFNDFGNALWGLWGIAIVIISFIIFAGGTGILVLLGGGWRWE